MDPRVYQVGFLFCLLVFGIFGRDFSITWAHFLTVMTVGIGLQAIAIRTFKISTLSFLSAAISCLSLLLLFRTTSVWILAAAALLSVGSKFVFRFRGKHFFNPTNFGIVVLLLFTQKSWLSPAQWGQDILFVAWISILGMTVARRARRDDVSLAFLGTYGLLLFMRVSYLHQPYAVLFHQLNNGGLLLFSFFMISDPKSTPDHRVGRVVFAVLVALLAYGIRFYLYNPNALLYSLFFLSPITLLIDNLWKSARFDWSNTPKIHLRGRYYATGISFNHSLRFYTRFWLLRLLRR